MTNDDDLTPEEEEKFQDLLRRSGRRLAGTYNPEDEYDSDELKDLTIAIGLLTGEWDDKKAAKRYYSGSEEKTARKAIVRLLRNKKPFDAALRNQLATLFDHEGEQPPYSTFVGAVERRLAFEFRRTGKPDVALRDFHLVLEYCALIEEGSPHQRAVNELCKKYKVSDTTVKEARRRNPRLQPLRAVIKQNKRPG
jgi:hypothetical protein